MKIIADTHAHTLASGHAYSTIKEMASAAKLRGLKALALTEHAPEMPGTCGLFYFQNLDVVPREADGVRLLMGAEVNIMKRPAGILTLWWQASILPATVWIIRRKKISGHMWRS